MAAVTFRKGEPCLVDGCNKLSKARGWCSMHYARWQRNGDPVGGRSYTGAPIAWIKHHADYNGDDCLFWPFPIAGVRAKLKFRGRTTSASRTMCTVAWGDPPSDVHDAAHSCGKGHLSCLNPKHLRWATKSENQLDRRAHGTACFGEKNPRARLKPEDVLAIRVLSEKHSNVRIAEMYGLDRTHVRRIVIREIWDWL